MVIVGLDQTFVILGFGKNSLDGEIRSSPKTLMMFLVIDGVKLPLLGPPIHRVSR